MALLKDWQDYAEKQSPTKQAAQAFWTHYFQREKEVYAKLLEETEPVSGTVQELADRYGIDLHEMTGFLDGINDSLKEPNPLDTMEADTVVSLDYDKELLYKNMVDSKAEWLYQLPQWNALLTPERQKELYKEQKRSGIIVKGPKVGRNDPCPCGSGKKYKFCCGKVK